MSDEILTSGATETEPPVEATPGPSLKSVRKSKSSTATKLIQAAALAAVLVPLGSIAVETSSCHFYASGGGSNCATGPEGGLLFDFADPKYQAELKFTATDGENLYGDFDVSIDDNQNTYAEITARFQEFFAGFQPVPIGSNLATPFINFEVSAPTPCTGTPEDCADAVNTWRSEGPRGVGAKAGYNLWIYWADDTDAFFPSPSVLHDTGETVQDGQFDLDITRIYFTCGPLDACSDPAAGGRDDMFFDFTLADDNAIAAVPEPATMVLLGTGLGGLLYRRRQRKQAAEKLPIL